MRSLYARLTRRELLDKEELRVSLSELTALAGTTLKVLVLIRNAGRCVRRAELQEVLQVDVWDMLRSLAWLERDHYIERTNNGWYRVLTFPYDGARRPTGKGQRSEVRG